MCYSEMELAVGKKRKTPKKKKKKTKVGSMEEGEESEPPGWIEVLTDLLLGFLSQPSQLWRNVTEQVSVSNQRKPALSTTVNLSGCYQY